MGKRGPAPKPTRLKLVAGNPGRRPLNAKEAKPDKALPACPSYLSAEAKKEWKRIAKDLHGCGLLTKIDRTALAAYCTAWARWVDAEAKLLQHGTIILSPEKKFPMASPYLGVARGAFDQMTKMLREFGMTPSARSSIQVDGVGRERSPLAEKYGIG